jgi:hypothetical protein
MSRSPQDSEPAHSILQLPLHVRGSDSPKIRAVYQFAEGEEPDNWGGLGLWAEVFTDWQRLKARVKTAKSIQYIASPLRAKSRAGGIKNAGMEIAAAARYEIPRDIVTANQYPVWVIIIGE